MAKRQLLPWWGFSFSLRSLCGRRHSRWATLPVATVEFLNVVADDGAQIGLATLNGDSLEFSPRLSSGATDGSTQTTVATLTFGLAAQPGFAIDSFAVQESGVMSLTGVGTFATTAWPTS
jgi:hypothetical protein